MSLLFFLAAGVSSETLPVLPTSAETEVSRVEALETEYAQHDYETLTRSLFEPASSEDAVAGLDWLGAKFRTDGSAYISYAYAMLLQQFAGQFPPEEAAQLRGTALAAMASAVLVASIDGQQCADVSARSEKAQLLSQTLLQSQSQMRDLSPDLRRFSGWIAWANEELTWETRQTLDQSAYLCRGGMMGMIAGLASGLVAERQPADGEIGRQFDVQVPPEFVFGRRENDEWLGDAEARRESRVELLKSILEIESLPSEEELEARLSDLR